MNSTNVLISNFQEMVISRHAYVSWHISLIGRVLQLAQLRLHTIEFVFHCPQFYNLNGESSDLGKKGGKLARLVFYFNK